MASPLTDLVEGYVRGKDQQMKQAREVASQQADAYERQFRVQQAQQQAAHAAGQLKNDTERVRLEGEANKRLAQKAIDDKAKADADRKSREIVAGIRAETLKDGNYLKNRANYIKHLSALETNYLKTGIAQNVQEAHSMAQSDLAQFDSSFAAPQPAAPDEKAEGGFSAQGFQQGMMQRLLGVPQAQGAQGAAQPFGGQQFVRPPSETPAGMQAPNPMVQKLQDAHSKIVADNALKDEKRKALALDAQATKTLIEARGTLTKAQAQKVKDDNARAAKFEKFKIDHETALTHSLEASAKAALQNANTATDREARLKIESDIKTSPSGISEKAKKDLQHQLQTTRTTALRLNEEVMKNVRAMANLDVQLAKPEIQASAANTKTIRELRLGYAAQLTDLKNKYVEANAEYLDTLKTAVENKVTLPTKLGGTPDHKAADANRAAIEKEAKKANRAVGALRPSYITPPPGMPKPGTRGELAPKKTLQKKPVGKKSANDPLGIR